MPQVVWEVWVSASDDRVCTECAARAGLLFRRGRGPQPPLHPTCRCSRAPAFVQVVDEPFDPPPDLPPGLPPGLPPWWLLLIRGPSEPEPELEPEPEQAPPAPPPVGDGWEDGWHDDLWWRWLIGGGGNDEP